MSDVVDEHISKRALNGEIFNGNHFILEYPNIDGFFKNKPVCGKCKTKKYGHVMELIGDNWECPNCKYSFDYKILVDLENKYGWRKKMSTKKEKDLKKENGKEEKDKQTTEQIQKIFNATNAEEKFINNIAYNISKGLSEGGALNSIKNITLEYTMEASKLKIEVTMKNIPPLKIMKSNKEKIE